MRSKAFAVGLWLLGFAAAAALAQQPVAFHGNSWKSYPGTTDGAPFVLHSEVAEVGVQLAVTDRSGKPVTGLLPDDLQILDNGIPAVITELRREDDLPLRVALVIDWSDSMRKNLSFERKVALDFVRNVLRPEIDQAMVVSFRYRVEVTQPLTGDLQSLEAGLRPVAGVTLSSVYDALVAATRGLQKADPYLAQRRVIVLLSDGEDNVSAHSLLDVIDRTGYALLLQSLPREAAVAFARWRSCPGIRTCRCGRGTATMPTSSRRGSQAAPAIPRHTALCGRSERHSAARQFQLSDCSSTTVAPAIVTSHPARLKEFATWGASSGPATTRPAIA